MTRRMLWAVTGHTLLLGVFFWWTGISDETKSQVALGAVVAVIWLAAFALLQTRIFREANIAALSNPKFWAAVALFAGTLVAAGLIVHWIPNVPGLGWQLTSAGLRFSLAWLLLNAAWCGLAWQASLPPAQNSALAMNGE